ncbi:hypothetical protein AB1Y20_023637 [Prymnesium parvum]|uniref:SWIM-type domain-containing protein n=1 Tax=Prymnesium parvum TaxID=97485 RepID=A0AB34JG01_PRYPA
MEPSALSLVQSVCDNVGLTRTVSDEQLRWLHFLCPGSVGGAAEILDHRTVTRCVARESRREFFTVDATSKRTHCTLPGFCTCCAYCYQVVARPDALLCKHELAVRLASALGLVQVLELEDAEWACQFSLAIGIPMSEYCTA